MRRHPTTHRPYVISGIGRKTELSGRDFEQAPRVHVVGGGGTAAPILAKLSRRGFKLSCGVLNAGDADQEVAEALDIAHVRQPAFSDITPESDRVHRELIAASEVVVLTDVPIGSGNLPNVRAVLDAVRTGTPVIVMRPDLVRERDFTGGAGEQMSPELMSRGTLIGSVETPGLLEAIAGGRTA